LQPRVPKWTSEIQIDRYVLTSGSMTIKFLVSTKSDALTVRSIVLLMIRVNKSGYALSNFHMVSTKSSRNLHFS
jgi:hypothetical protein